MKRVVLIFISSAILLSLVNLADVSAETYPCCCEISGYLNGWNDWNEMCVMGSSVSGPHPSSYEASTECVKVCHEIANSMESSTSYFPHIIRIYSFSGNRCSGKQCVNINYDEPEPPEETCNGVDDDEDGLVDEDDATCVNSTCLSEGDCPLGSVCGFRKAGSVAGTGAVGEEENCEICESKCKVCPPHPPNATENNPLGICAPESQGGYPMSKNCLDWKNKISCMTCEDKDGDGKRESFKAREDDGKFGVDKDGKPIFSRGDKVECGVDWCTFPKIEKPENNKDYNAEDKVIDCRLAIFSLYNEKASKETISEKNALFGVCNNGICESPTPESCMTDCYSGIDKRIKNSDAEDIPMAITLCSNDKKNFKSFKGCGAVKIADKTWGELKNDNSEDCKMATLGAPFYTCFLDKNSLLCSSYRFNGKLQKDTTPFPLIDLQKRCAENVKKVGGNEKNAYFYSYILWGGKSGCYAAGNDCYCEKASVDLEQFTKLAELPFDLKDKDCSPFACYPTPSIGCTLQNIQLAINNLDTPEVKEAFFNSLKEWVLS